jgi:molybdopterin synthase catalytic subunit
MIDKWIGEIKQKTNPQELGMILAHNGIVRGTSKSGKPVQAMRLTYDREKLNSVLPGFEKRAGIICIKVWINSGDLKVGDDIMFVAVAGRFRTDVLPVFEELISVIKREIVAEEEIG